MTEVGKIATSVITGGVLFAATLATWVVLWPEMLGGAIFLGAVTGGLLGFGAGFGTFELLEAVHVASLRDQYAREEAEEKAKAEFERMMREEERKTRA